LEFIKNTCPKKVIPYLEFLVSQGETGTLFHDELASQYIDSINLMYDSFGGLPTKKPYPEPGAEPGDIGRYRKAFLHFLETSNYYRPQALMTGNKIPNNCLFEERAAILSKLGAHDAVLAIYALDLENSAKAEEYCTKHMNDDETKDPFFTLLQVYLKPPQAAPGAPPRPTEPMMGPALKLLSEHYKHMSIKDALNLLPESTNLSALMPFFTRVLTEGARQRRDGQLVAALLKSEHQRVNEDHIAACSPFVYIDENTVCAKCHRPLRTSAFVRYPEKGEIFHLMCHQKAESASAAASATNNDNLVDGEPQQFFDNPVDFQDMTGMPTSNASAMTSDTMFDDVSLGSLSGAAGSAFLSNSLLEDYNPEGETSRPTKGTNPFEEF